MNENIENYRQRKKSRAVKKKRKNPLVLVFDENARREFLTGFRKRKLQKRNKAKEEFEKKLKLERKRIKNEAKESYKKLLLSKKPLPQLEDLLAEEIDMGTHSVSITELSTAELARKNNWIGINEVQYENPSEENNGDSRNENFHEIEGMEIEQKKNYSRDVPFKNSKGIRKLIRQQATSKVKNSKIFKKKTKLEHFKFVKQEKKKEKKRRKKLRKKQMNNV